MPVIYPAISVQPALWLKDKLVGFALNVNSIAPSGYAAYARLLNPAYLSSTDKPVRVSWQSVADQVGMAIDKASQWETLVALLPEEVLNRYEPPLEGSVDPESYAELIAILKTHTNTPDVCWYGVWEGYGYIRESFKKAPKFFLPGRSYHLLEGALTLPPVSFCDGSFFQSANIFWPDDRAWCVASEIDFNSTYIAASEKAIQDLLTNFPGELFQVVPEERVTLK
jgi:hypothetical protein